MIGHFWITFGLFKYKAWCSTICMKMGLICMRMKTYNHMKEYKDSLEKEAKGNSEMAN